LQQPDFRTAVAKRNVALRIPAPMFGAGLIEQIPDSVIVANQVADQDRKRTLGIAGRTNVGTTGRSLTGQSNTNGNPSEIGRFGWKAQHNSILLFAAEAYNLEMGISNELFPDERDQHPDCSYEIVAAEAKDAEQDPAIDTLRRYRSATGHRYMTADDRSTIDNPLSVEKFAAFIRHLAAPESSRDGPGSSESRIRGRHAFESVGCAACHTPALKTGDNSQTVFRARTIELYSDLLLHDMGPELADGIAQGKAGPRDFRTAPLWGLGQRIFFLHDGRTKDLLAAIRLHRSGDTATRDASEASAVIDRFEALQEQDKQDVLNFLRSL
jgi:CxxC motif-containing protein (DUF1111 family)